MTNKVENVCSCSSGIPAIKLAVDVHLQQHLSNQKQAVRGNTHSP
jgi:hypothetical protein